MLAGWHYLFLAWLLLAFPSGRIGSRRGRGLLTVLVAVQALRSVVRLLLYVPPDGTGCQCVQNRFTPVGDPTLVDLTEDLYPWLLTVLLILIVGEVVADAGTEAVVRAAGRRRRCWRWRWRSPPRSPYSR